jgi:hypothetical protein
MTRFKVATFVLIINGVMLLAVEGLASLLGRSPR